MIILENQISKVRRNTFLFSVFCLLSFVLCGCQSQDLYKESRLMMGTIVEVISPDKQAASIAFKEMQRVEALLSLYKDNSEISRLNKQGKLKVSPETIFIIKKAGEFWQATDGAFDITVAPLVALWGFYDQEYQVPDDSAIEEKLDLIGFDKLRINDNIIKFGIKDMMIDLGAIAKGFIVDCAIKKLKLAGISSALINAGGDIYCLGDKRGIPWRVAIKSEQNFNSVEYLDLKDKAVATSGNYERYFFIDNVRYCHIFNPKTARPADSGVTSVTVVADDCLSADAIATSIFVLGKHRGEDLAKRFNAQVRIYTDVQDNQ